jgi:hypothetical protein
MQWPGFSSVRTHRPEFQQDLRRLDQFLRETATRLARLTASREPISIVTGSGGATGGGGGGHTIQENGTDLPARTKLNFQDGLVASDDAGNDATKVNLQYAAPSSLVGLTSSAGTATSVLRSDAQLALDQSISPTWTGLHTWQSTVARTYSFVLTTPSPDLGLGLAVENQNSGGGTTLFLRGYSTASEKGHLSLYFSRLVNPPNFQQFVLGRAPQNRDELEISFNDENNVTYPMWALSRTGKMFLGRTTGGFLKTGNDVRFYLENVDNTGGAQVGTAFRIKSHSDEFLAIHLQDSDNVGTFNLRNKRSTGEYWMSIVGNASAPAGTVGFFVQSTSDNKRASLERDASGAGHVVVATGAAVDVLRLDGSKRAIKLSEATADPGAVADYGWIYAKDVAGLTELFWQNSAGTVVQITSGSGLSGSGSGSFGNPTALVGLTPVNGSATTAMRSDAAPALDQSISPTWTGTHTFEQVIVMKEQATDPVGTTDYGKLYTKDVSGVTELFYRRSSGPGTLQITSGTKLNLTSGNFSAPTALVGLTAVPGTLTTAMRSDAAPALDQSIAPTWTAQHTFDAGLRLGPSSGGLFESQVPSAVGNVQFKLQPTATMGTSDSDRYIFDLRRSSSVDELYYRADRLLWTQAGIFTGGITPAGWGVNVGVRFGNAMFHAVTQDVGDASNAFEVQGLNVQLDFSPGSGSSTVNPLTAVGGNFEANYRSSAQNTADNVFLKGGRFIARHEKIGRAAETVGGRFECYMSPGDNAGTISGDLIGGQFYMQLTGSFGVNTPNMSVDNLLGYHAVQPAVVGSWGTQQINVACAPIFIEDWGSLYQLAVSGALAHAIIIKSQTSSSAEKGNLFLESAGWNTGHIQFGTGTGASHLFLGNDTSMSPTQAGFAIKTGAPTAANNFDAIFTTSRLTFKDGYIVRAAGGLKLGKDAFDSLGFWGVTPVTQHSTTGETAGFTAGTGTAARVDSKYTGNVGTKAYTVGDIVKALKRCGIMAS